MLARWTIDVNRYLDAAVKRGLDPVRFPHRLVDRAPAEAAVWAADEAGECPDESRKRLLDLLASELAARHGLWDPLLSLLTVRWFEGGSPVPWLQAVQEAGMWQQAGMYARLYLREPEASERAAVQAVVDRAKADQDAWNAVVAAFAENPGAATWRAVLAFAGPLVPETRTRVMAHKLLLEGVSPTRLARGLMAAGEVDMAEDLLDAGLLDPGEGMPEEDGASDPTGWGAPVGEG